MYNSRAIDLMKICCVPQNNHSVLFKHFSLVEIDTTFNIGPYYLTALCFMNVMLTQPVITPVMMFFHFSKDEIVFKNLFHDMQRIVGQEYLSEMLACADNEPAIFNNLGPYFKLVIPCGAHSKGDLIEKLKVKGIKENQARAVGDLIYGSASRNKKCLVDMVSSEFIAKYKGYIFLSL